MPLQETESMLFKHVMRNRNLKEWVVGASLLSAAGCDLAASILDTVATGLRFF